MAKSRSSLDVLQTRLFHSMPAMKKPMTKKKKEHISLQRHSCARVHQTPQLYARTARHRKCCGATATRDTYLTSDRLTDPVTDRTFHTVFAALRLFCECTSTVRPTGLPFDKRSPSPYRHILPQPRSSIHYLHT